METYIEKEIKDISLELNKYYKEDIKSIYENIKNNVKNNRNTVREIVEQINNALISSYRHVVLYVAATAVGFVVSVNLARLIEVVSKFAPEGFAVEVLSGAALMLFFTFLILVFNKMKFGTQLGVVSDLNKLLREFDIDVDLLESKLSILSEKNNRIHEYINNIVRTASSSYRINMNEYVSFRRIRRHVSVLDSAITYLKKLVENIRNVFNDIKETYEEINSYFIKIINLYDDYRSGMTLLRGNTYATIVILLLYSVLSMYYRPFLRFVESWTGLALSVAPIAALATLYVVTANRLSRVLHEIGLNTRLVEDKLREVEEKIREVEENMKLKRSK